MHRLILFEGLPGSGKSTLSQEAYLQLHRTGVGAQWFAEDQRPHPLVDEADLAGMGEPVRLAEYAVGQWRRLTAQVSGSNVLFDAALFGMTLGTLLRAGAEADLLTRTALEIEAEIAHLQPMLVFLRPADVDTAFSDALASRGESWVTYMAQELSTSPFARSGEQTGEDLVLAYLTELDGVYNTAFDALSCAREKVCSVHQDSRRATEDIRSMLDIVVPEGGPTGSVERLAGTYRCLENDSAITFRAEGSDLVIDQERGARLIHVDGDEFMVQGMPVTVRFETGPGNADCLYFEARTANPSDFPREWVRS